jgi:hypothetical protein
VRHEHEHDAEHDAEDDAEAARIRALSEHVRSVREGHGANCSSIGSVVDTLFATAVVGGAVLAALAAMMGAEPKREGDAPEEPGEGSAAGKEGP